MVHVHLVDGTYELFRSFYGAPDSGPTTATRVLSRSLLKLVRDESATHVAVAFDHEIESFRNELFAGYKTGEGIDPVLFAQFDLAERAARALGFVVWPMVEFEADDALATAAERFGALAEVERVFVASPDKDLAQCIRGERVVGLDRRRGTILDEAGVHAKFGVAPASIPDWLALVGDDADGIPGIPRWGAKSAATVLASYGRIASIPTDPATWEVKVRGAASLSRELEARRDEAALYRELATLRTDVELAEGLEELRWRGADDTELGALADELDDPGLIERAATAR